MVIKCFLLFIFSLLVLNWIYTLIFIFFFLTFFLMLVFAHFRKLILFSLIFRFTWLIFIFIFLLFILLSLWLHHIFIFKSIFWGYITNIKSIIDALDVFLNLVNLFLNLSHLHLIWWRCLRYRLWSNRYTFRIAFRVSLTYGRNSLL